MRERSNAGTLTNNKDIRLHFRYSKMDNNDRKRSSYKKIAINMQMAPHPHYQEPKNGEGIGLLFRTLHLSKP